MSDDDTDAFNPARRKGPLRIEVLNCPSAAQIAAIPLGSDVVYTTQKEFAAGPLNETIRDSLLFLAQTNERNMIHGAYLAYLPPDPGPNLPAEDIVQAIMSDQFGIVPQDEDTFTVSAPELWYMLMAAVTRAREGMAVLPF